MRGLLAKQKESGDVSIHAIRDHFYCRNNCTGDPLLDGPGMPRDPSHGHSDPVPLDDVD